MSSFIDANDEIAASLRRLQRQRAARQRMLRPLRAVDGLLAELEELNLAGRKRVPESFEPLLTAVIELLPAELGIELRSRITIAHLMDRLYEVQEHLLAMKAAGETPLTEAS